MDKKPLVMGVAAHCDDIEFLFAGTLLKYHEKHGYEVCYVESTNNMSGAWAVNAEDEPQLPPGNYKREKCQMRSGRFYYNVPWFIEMPQRKKEAADAAAVFGTEPVFLDYPQRHYRDENLKSVYLCFGSPRPECIPESTLTIVTAHDSAAEVAKVADLILKEDPEVIITHAPVDYTEEHTATSHLVRKAFLAAKEKGYDGSLVFVHPVTSGEYGAFFDQFDTFIDMTGFEKKKLDVLKKHACQVPYPELLDIEDVPRGRRCGVGAAELYYVFELSKTRTGILTEELKQNYRRVTTDR